MQNPIKWHSEKRMISELTLAEYNPRQASEKETEDLINSIERFSLADPIIINRNNHVIGGHFRLKVLKTKGVQEVDVRVPDQELTEAQEKELNLRLNRNTGNWDFDLLANFDEELLKDIGFSPEELDLVFDIKKEPALFNLEEELEKLKIEKIDIQKGDVFQLGQHRLMCGDSTIESDVLKLMNGEKADMCFTDPPYILDYTHTKYKGKGPGFGYKRNRKYLETDELPDDFTSKWMAGINKVQKDNFSIIVFENWKNIRTIWSEMEKYWKIKNMIVWHTLNRCQGFGGKYRFFSKHDIAMVGSVEEAPLDFNLEDEEGNLQNEYKTALYAITGHPQWEPYKRGNKYCPTDFISSPVMSKAKDGQNIVFGTKPLEILIPYIKVLTKRDGLIVEPFGGSGSTLIASEIMKRKCFVMEKVPIYAEIIKRRWENHAGKKAEKING